ncbi:hypothetical protein NE298_11560 [Lactococcus lactis]|uniref:hypothetical protein n=1 Tax=Lactococcus lactis TaxID=1358 RepID=UPI0020732908|nr:hypothetical protein [Lactococcus lactis]MCM6847355.1 hypothetical protein [Lactococcus lactis]
MTEISGKSLHEIYKEDARKYKESIEKGRVYSESADSLIGNFDKSESLTVTIPMEEFDKLEKLALSAHTDKLSVEKFQEQLNTAKKALTEIAEIINADIHECNYGCDNNCELNGSLIMYSVENVQSVICSALAEIGGDR